MSRPFLYVLAGVNGAGKSSVGGHVLREAGLDWFNPDTFARGLRELSGLSQAEANAQAWQEGVNRIRDALDQGRNHAFETTLGGNSIAALLHEASHSHDVLMWFCGLSSPEQHIARVQARVRSGGHPINEADIRRRWPLAQQNLVRLMPVLAQLQVYDNSADAAPGEAVPDPQLLLQMEDGQLLYPEPDNLAQLAATPAWATPLLEVALRL
ncbi:AAA family ATPase [Stenotrophomonas sp. 9(2022)]|uniref:AAA family ATPase n=1 Tax=Stenotrophomonas sp. 9(2022) TaxID=2950153 RepID=UPI002113CCB4|nr:AAA family ATPase [Stenotrophomonas sp. 9(2022)]